MIETRVIKLYSSGLSAYEIEMNVGVSQEFINKITYMYRRLKDSDISIECNSIPPVTEGTTFNAYPVPFIDEITINYALDYDTDVVLEVYDSKGTLLERVVNTNYSKAKLEVIKINLERYGNQMLFVKLTTNRETYTKKLIATEPKRQHK